MTSVVTPGALPFTTTVRAEPTAALAILGSAIATVRTSSVYGTTSARPTAMWSLWRASAPWAATGPSSARAAIRPRGHTRDVCDCMFDSSCFDSCCVDLFGAAVLDGGRFGHARVTDDSDIGPLLAHFGRRRGNGGRGRGRARAGAALRGRRRNRSAEHLAGRESRDRLLGLVFGIAEHEA